MIDVTRRRILGTAGAAALAPFAVAAPAASDSAGGEAVPSGRADGVRTGGARRIKLSSGHEVWTKQVGHGPIPMLTLHGGPGATHFYFECFEDFVPRDRVRFWYYDQLGCGFSDAPDDTSLWTVDRYRAEVEEVRAALGVERLVLYGQSWGGMLGIEYALAFPQRVERLIVSNMTASVPSYVEYVTTLRKALPPDVDAAMRTFEDAGKFAAPEYQALLIEHLYNKHICRLDPWPEPVERAFAHLSQSAYNTMQGPSEFVVTGNFKNWDRWADLARIEVPTLLIVGRHDTMAVAQIERMSKLMPHAELVVCENGSHMSLYDDQRAYFAALLPFVLASSARA
jgi:proline iminopeptidase